MIEVKPIKDITIVEHITESLSRYHDDHGRRVYLLWVTGIWTGLRVSDLVRLQKGNVSGGYIRLQEQKTRKQTIIPIARQLQAVYDAELQGVEDDEFLFVSRQRDAQGRPQHICTNTAYNDLKQIQKRFKIQDDFGCHSMRKTFGYWHYQANHDLELLRQHFNHSSVAITRRYIGIDIDEREQAINKISYGRRAKGARIDRARHRPASRPLERKATRRGQGNRRRRQAD